MSTNHVKSAVTAFCAFCGVFFVCAAMLLLMGREVHLALWCLGAALLSLCLGMVLGGE